MATGPKLCGKLEEVGSLFGEREDDPTPLLEEYTHIKLVSLSERESDSVSRILEKKRRSFNPMSVWSRKEELFTPKGLRSLLISQAKKRFPPLVWVPQLTCRDLAHDLVAGLTVGVMAIPQAMSYASIIGVPYVVGLYTAFVPTLIYAFVGTSKHLVVGPVAMESLLIASGLSGLLTKEECPQFYAAKNKKSQPQLCPEQYSALVFTTTLVVGILEAAASVFGLGMLLRFMGKPVITGFTAGSAVVIMTSQIKDILGITIPNAETLQKVIDLIIGEKGNINTVCVGLGLAFIAYLVIHRYITGHPKCKRFLGWLQPLGPLIVVIVGALIVGNSGLKNQVKYVGAIPAGMPPLKVPFTQEMMYRVLPTAVGAFVVGDMEAIAIGKGIADKYGYTIDSTQELVAQGIANLLGSVSSCYTATGSFSRSAVNERVGGKTQTSALISALVVMFTLLFLTSWFFWVPKFALAAIVITSVIPLIDIGNAIKLYKLSRKDFLVWLLSAALVMFLGILEGIAAGVALSLAIVIYETAKPQIIILWRIPGTTIYRNIKQESAGTFIPNMFICRLGSSLYFANVTYVKQMLMMYVEAVSEVNKIEYMILEMTPVVSLDYTASQVLEAVVIDFRRKGIELAFAMVGTRLRADMVRTGLLDKIGNEWFFHTVNEAVNYCLKHQRAKAIVDAPGSGELEMSQKQSLSSEKHKVLLGSEISISNDTSNINTVVFMNLESNSPEIIADILKGFAELGCVLKGAHAEQFDDVSWRHRYFIQSSTGGKLSADEVDLLRAHLEQCLALSV